MLFSYQKWAQAYAYMDCVHHNNIYITSDCQPESKLQMKERVKLTRKD